MAGGGACARPKPEAKIGIAWEKSSKVWKEIESLIPQLQMVLFSGGEPALAPGTLHFLERCVAAGRQDSMALILDSNLTTLPDRLLKAVARFRYVMVQVSLDGFGPVNEYIRYPSRWPVVAANLERLARLPSVDINVMSMLQIYNILALPDLLRHIEAVARAHRREIRWQGQLVQLDELDLSALPAKVLALGARRLKDFRSRSLLCRQDGGLRRSVDELLAALSAVKPARSATALRAFHAFTRALDRRRRQRFARALPELHRMLRGS
jgi:hypothetical protein